MPLIDDIAAGNLKGACAVERAIETRPDLAAELVTLIGRVDIGHRALANACRKNNITITESIIRRHRTGDCQWCAAKGRTWV